MFTIGIYNIVNIANGDCYIGSSQNIRKRKLRHKCELDRGIHSNEHLQRAWNKYGGVEGFNFEVIEETTKDLLIEREQYYINTIKPRYNICREAYSTRGRIATEETRQRMSETRAGMWHSGISRENMSVAAIQR